MPWLPEDAPSHNSKATGAAAKQWAAVANKTRQKTGSDKQAVIIANAAVKNRKLHAGMPKSRK
jgi:hypothetical protein